MLYRHEGKSYDVEVGKPDPRIGEVVIAILETVKTQEDTLPPRPYLICTPNRGVMRGEPILIGRDEVLYATDFEP